MKKAVFLDRDGVINEVLSHRVKFVNRPEQFYLLDGVGEAIRKLNENDFLVFVVTNQGGVGLGFIKESMLIKIHEKMKKDLEKFNAKVDDIAYCPHKPNLGCLCRKPGSKMLTDLAEKYNVDLTESYMVGDRDVDIEAGIAAGVKTIFIGENDKGFHPAFPNLLEAVCDLIEK